MSGRASCRMAWPYEVLAVVPYDDLVAVDDCEAWQQQLALKLLEADAVQVGYEWSADSADLPACGDAVVRACCGVPVRELGLCYAPVEQQVEARVASVSAWLAKETRWTQADLLGALAHVRRHAVPCELPAAPMQWVLPPKFLGEALPSATGGLEHFVDHGQLIIRAGSGGLGAGEVATRRFGQRSSDEQLLEFGIYVPRNPLDSYIIHDMPGAAMAAWDGRDAAGTSSSNGEPHRMKLRAAQIAEFAASTIGTDMNNAMLLRDADAIGPSWPGIPGPNLCDLNTIVIARWLTAPRDLLTAPPVLSEESKVTMEEWGTQVSQVMRQPLPLEDELRAWRCLLLVLEAELKKRPTIAADQQLLDGAGASMLVARERSQIEFRLDKTKLLVDAIVTLRGCITSSVASSKIAIAPEAHKDSIRSQVEPELKELADCLSEEFVKQAIRMPPAVRKLLLRTGPCEHHIPNEVAPAQLLRSLRLPEAAYRAAWSGLQQKLECSVLRERAALPPSACVALRRAVDAAVVGGSKPHGTDTVDGAPDFQVNLTVDQMSDVVGIANMLRLGNLVERFGASSSSSSSLSTGAAGTSNLAPTEPTHNFLKQAEQTEGLEVFVRRYSSAGRPWIPFHCDSARVTCNIALCPEKEFSGGELLVLTDGQVTSIVREEGEATVHASTLLHGVSRIANDGGVRYSLIIFVGNAIM